jgi:hypothetical protein
MARQSNVYFIGRKSNVVALHGRAFLIFVIILTELIKAKRPGKARANMGKASKIGAAFRHVFAPVLTQPKDKNMQNDFTGVIKNGCKLNPLNNHFLQRCCLILRTLILIYIQFFKGLFVYHSN